MTTTLLVRIAPPALTSRRRALHLLERNLKVSRHSWGILLSGFAEPVFYLFAVGVGLGALVGDVRGPDGQPVTYAEYVAPALLASSAMNGALFESTFNIFFKLRYMRTYDAILATPMEPADIAVGEVSWSLLRGGLYAVGFLAVTALMGLLLSPLAVLALPAALLVGFAFAAVGMAASTFMRTWQDFDLVTLFSLPLFLFSATFFPITVYPDAIQPFVRLSPLYHGVELIRGLMLGAPDVTMFGHVAFLVAMGLAGAAVAGRRFSRILRA
ncbi:MAG: ABC transporter permease [Actinobacteria bacterium]|nr:ABC transporter permease [Actinomycetota bacterium]